MPIDTAKPGVLRFSRHALLALWAGFWLWFSVASSIGEPNGLAHLLVPALPIVVCLLLVWQSARLGGLALILFAVGSASMFRGREAWLLLSAPAMVLGVGYVLSGRAGLRAPR